MQSELAHGILDPVLPLVAPLLAALRPGVGVGGGLEAELAAAHRGLPHLDGAGLVPGEQEVAVGVKNDAVDVTVVA